MKVNERHKELLHKYLKVFRFAAGLSADHFGKGVSRTKQSVNMIEIRKDPLMDTTYIVYRLFFTKCAEKNIALRNLLIISLDDELLKKYSVILNKLNKFANSASSTALHCRVVEKVLSDLDVGDSKLDKMWVYHIFDDFFDRELDDVPDDISNALKLLSNIPKDELRDKYNVKFINPKNKKSKVSEAEVDELIKNL